MVNMNKSERKLKWCVLFCLYSNDTKINKQKTYDQILKYLHSYLPYIQTIALSLLPVVRRLPILLINVDIILSRDRYKVHLY